MNGLKLENFWTTWCARWKQQTKPAWSNVPARVAKVELPPAQKRHIMRSAEISGITLYDELLRYGYIEPMDTPPTETSDEGLKKLSMAEAAEYLSQSDYERWRELKDPRARSKYISPLSGIVRER